MRMIIQFILMPMITFVTVFLLAQSYEIPIFVAFMIGLIMGLIGTIVANLV